MSPYLTCGPVLGDTPLGADLHTVTSSAPGTPACSADSANIEIQLTDVVVKGWPWNTTAVIRLAIAATLADGTPYANEAIQWLTIRWGRLVVDEVFGGHEGPRRGVSGAGGGRGRLVR